MTIVEAALIGLNDLHGNLSGRGLTYTDPWTGQTGAAGGVARLVGAVRARAAGMANVSIVHSGDMVGAGPPEATLLHNDPVIDVLNAIGLAAGTPGNHEFDDGLGELLRLAGRQNFPLVSSNIRWRKTGATVFRPYLIRRIAGVPVAFIGATVRFAPLLTAPGATDELVFLDEVEAVRSHLPELAARGIRAVVLLLHEGGRQQAFPDGPVSPRVCEIAAGLPEVGVVMAGHTHFSINTHVGETLVVQAAPFGTAFSAVRLSLDDEKGLLVRAHGELVPVWEGEPEAPDVSEIVARARAEVSGLTGRMVGVAARALRAGRHDGATDAGESPLGNLIADAFRAAAGADLAFVNPGAIRAMLPAGAVTWGDLLAMLPARNDLLRCSMTGRQLWSLLDQQNRFSFKRNLEVSGLRYGFGIRADGRGEVRFLHDAAGAPIEAGPRTYRVAATRFLASGGDGYDVFTQARSLSSCINEIDAVADHICTLPSPFDAAIEGRIVRIGR